LARECEPPGVFITVHTEHLPIYKANDDLCLYLEQRGLCDETVRDGFRRGEAH